MKHSNHSRLGTQVFRIFGEALHHRPGCIEQQAIHFGRRIQTQRIDLLSQGEYDMEVRYW